MPRFLGRGGGQGLVGAAEPRQQTVDLFLLDAPVRLRAQRLHLAADAANMAIWHADDGLVWDNQSADDALGHFFGATQSVFADRRQSGGADGRAGIHAPLFARADDQHALRSHLDHQGAHRIFI